MTKISELIGGLLSLFIGLPIWLFLLYSILKAIQPDRLVWFLFWIYVPVQIIIGILTGIVKSFEEGK